MRLIEGAVMADEDSELEALRDEVRRLNVDLSAARREASNARRDADRAMAELRRQLGPLYKAMQMVFGELDAAGIEDSSGPAPSNARVSAVWDSWKSRVGSSAKVIDALLLHGEMNTGQLAVATGFHRTTIPAHVFKLNKLGLLNKNAGRFSLKKLS